MRFLLIINFVLLIYSMATRAEDLTTMQDSLRDACITNNKNLINIIASHYETSNNSLTIQEREELSQNISDVRAGKCSNNKVEKADQLNNAVNTTESSSFNPIVPRKISNKLLKDIKEEETKFDAFIRKLESNENLSVSVDGSIVVTDAGESNNVLGANAASSQRTLSGNANISYNSEPWQFNLMASGLHTKTSGLVSNIDNSAELSTKYYFLEDYYYTFNGSWEEEPFMGYDTILQGTAGIGRDFIKTDKFNLTASLSTGGQYESIVSYGEGNIANRTHAVVFNAIPTWQINKYLSLSEDLKLTGTGTNYILDSNTQLKLQLTQLLYISLYYDYKEYHDPVPNFRKTQGTTTVNLGINLN